MKDLLTAIDHENAILVTAPPGWGKTYKILRAIKETKRKCVFVFPLRALCDEVYLSALKFKISVCNLRKASDQTLIKNKSFDLVVSTAECLSEESINFLAEDYVFIFDEAHLLFYWGDTFRPRLIEGMENVLALAPPVFFLSATMNNEVKDKLQSRLNLNYKDIYHVDFGNQKLKNLPAKIFIYPKRHRDWILDDLYYSDCTGVKLVFCQYRSQVKQMKEDLEQRGFRVLGCVGGQASEFTQKLVNVSDLDVIVATSVVSHGVNLPFIKKIYFLYKIENLDFYLQMVGRGGRDGGSFEIHTMNTNYFNRLELFKGYLAPYRKIVRNKVNSYLY